MIKIEAIHVPPITQEDRDLKKASFSVTFRLSRKAQLRFWERRIHGHVWAAYAKRKYREMRHQK